MALGFNEWLAIASAGVAVVSVALNWMVVRRQNALQFEALRAAHDSDLIAVEAIVAHKRVFISEVFDTIDPRRRQNVLSALDYARAEKQAVKARA